MQNSQPSSYPCFPKGRPFVKVKIVNTLVFAGHTVSVGTT